MQQETKKSSISADLIWLGMLVVGVVAVMIARRQFGWQPNLEWLADLRTKWVLVIFGSLCALLAISRSLPRRSPARAWMVENVQVVMSVVVVVFLLIRPYLFQAFFIPTESMVQTLLVGDRLIVNKLVYRLRPPERGEVAVFIAPPEARSERDVEQDYIKRVVGLPGETIEVRPGIVYVDGKKLFSYSEQSAHTDGAGDPARFLRVGLPRRGGEPYMPSPSEGGRVLELGDVRVIASPTGDAAVRDRRLYVDGKPLADLVDVNADYFERGKPLAEWGGDPAVQAAVYGMAPEAEVIVAKGREITIEPPHVTINGKPLAEPYLWSPMTYVMGPVKIPPGQFFMMGDNRNNSKDSHEWGPLDAANYPLVGRAEIRFWPWNRIEVLHWWLILFVGGLTVAWMALRHIAALVSRRM